MYDVSGKHVFLSGPMSGLEFYNVGEFAKAHALLKERGVFSVYNPALEYLGSGSSESSNPHAFWMRRCIHELTTPCGYNVLVSLPGWESSDGARIEREVAKACGIEVYDLGEVI